ncbi:MAG: HEPN domain-containing protein [Candidatus Omnitrophica bacterium]|nr:HEPN domain-containing protein [Candidatus Omnitrophota bacterium]
MVDIRKQVDHWREGAEKSWSLGVRIIEWGDTLEGLFFIHLALEKMLKAHVCRTTQDLAPRIHRLTRLLEMASLEVQEPWFDLLAQMNSFQVGGRYPEIDQEAPDSGEARDLVARCEEVFLWLKNQL